jgi:hypothetical protein
VLLLVESIPNTAIDENTDPEMMTIITTRGMAIMFILLKFILSFPNYKRPYFSHVNCIWR